MIQYVAKRNEFWVGLTQLLMPSARTNRVLDSGLAWEEPAGRVDAQPWMQDAVAVVEELGELGRRACSVERRDDHGIDEASLLLLYFRV